MKCWGIPFSFGLLTIAILAACAGQPAEVQSTPAIVTNVSPTVPPADTPEPTSTPQPTETKTPKATVEPTQTPEPTAVPALGEINEASQWWDGDEWQDVQEAGPYQFNGSSLALIDGETRTDIVIPDEMIRIIREGKLKINKFEKMVTNDTSVMRGFDADGNEWRVFYYENPEWEGVVYAGVLKFSYDTNNPIIIDQQPIAQPVEITSQVLGADMNVWGLDFGGTLVTVKNIQISSITSGSVSGMLNGEVFQVPSLLVTIQFRHPDTNELVTTTFRNLDWFYAMGNHSSDEVDSIAAELPSIWQTLLTFENGLSRDEVLLVHNQLVGNDQAFLADDLSKNPQIWWALFPRDDRNYSAEEIVKALLNGGWYPYEGINFRSIRRSSSDLNN